MTRTREENASGLAQEEAEAASEYVVIQGNPIDGFRIRGPYKTWENAHAFAEDSEEPWWITELEEP